MHAMLTTDIHVAIETNLNINNVYRGLPRLAIDVNQGEVFVNRIKHLLCSG